MKNLILACESQKILGHNLLDSHMGSQFYIRAKKDVVFMGLYPLISKYLIDPITQEDIDVATSVLKRRGQYSKFNMKRWQKIVDEYDGKLPISIRSREEGELVFANDVMMVIDIWEPDYSWLGYHLDAIFFRAIWYPSTVATRLHEMKKKFRDCGIESPVILSDISGKMAHTEEAASIIGACTRMFFDKSESLIGDEYIRQHYHLPTLQTEINEPVPATYIVEHNTVIGWKDEKTYIKKLKKLPLNSSISCLIDTYDINECLKLLLSDAVQSILIDRNITMYICPDSVEDVRETIEVARIALEHFERSAFLPCRVRISQTGITPESLSELFSLCNLYHIDIDNFVFTFEDNLLQNRMSRNVYGFEFRMCAYKDKDGWHDAQKRPSHRYDQWSLKGYQGNIGVETRFINGYGTYWPSTTEIVNNIGKSL